MRRVTEWLRAHPGVRYALAVCVIVPGLAATLLATTIGHCSAFGGRCPAEPVPWWDNDVLGVAWIGVGISIAAAVLAARPTRRGLLHAAAAGVGGGFVAGLLAASSAAG